MFRLILVLAPELEARHTTPSVQASTLLQSSEESIGAGFPDQILALTSHACEAK